MASTFALTRKTSRTRGSGTDWIRSGDECHVSSCLPRISALKWTAVPSRQWMLRGEVLGGWLIKPEE